MQFRIPVVALQARRSSNGLAVQLGKRLRQLVERTAHDLHVVRLAQVLNQGGLRCLVLHIATRMGAAQSPPQALIRHGEEVLHDVLGAGDFLGGG